MNAYNMTDEELIAEIKARKLERHVQQEQWCYGCHGKWQAYLGSYDADGYTLRCHGCLRAVGKCTCR